ncbi:MAG: hypothetical protein QXY90_06110, partial [Candidatus Anstonellales archaeon]
PGNAAPDGAQVVIGAGQTTTDFQFEVQGSRVGKALVSFDETGDQNILTASASGTTVANLTRAGNLQIEGTISDLSGTTLVVDDDLQINGNDILDSAGTTRISLGLTTTLTNTTTTLSGTTALTASSLGTFTTAATLGMTSTTTLNLGSSATITSSATSLNLQSDGSIDVNLAGGSGATGCTIANSTGNLTCSGNITTTSTSGTQGWWTRTAGNLSPTNTNDTISATSSASTVATFTASGTNTALLLQATGTGTTADLLLLTQTSTGTITDAIDVSDETITNAINVGANTILGTTADLDFTNFDVSGSTGNITTAGDLAINGGDITSTATTFNFDIGNTGTLRFRDGTNNLLQIIDDGTYGRLALTVAASQPSTCTEGQIYADDNGNLYYCEAANTWVDLTVQGGGTNYWTLSAGVVSPDVSAGASVIAATSSATTVATFTSNGSNSPLLVQAGGTDAGDIVFDLTNLADFEIRAGGTAFVTFNETGLTTFVDDVDMTFGAGEDLNITAGAAPTVDLVSISNSGQGTVTNGVDGLSVDFVAATGGTSETNAGVHITITDSGDSGDTISGVQITAGTATAGTQYGLRVDSITGGAGTEYAISIGSGWDAAMDAGGLPILNIGAAGTDFSSTGGLTLADGLTVSSGGATISAGGLTVTAGALAVNSDSITSDGTLTINATNTVFIGDGTNGLQIDETWGANSGWRGNARPTKRITLVPEYPGAVLTGDGTNNNGTMTSDNTTAAGTKFRNYYNWANTQSTPQDYDIWISVPIPNDFAAMTATPTLSIDTYTSDLTNGTVLVTVYDSQSTPVADCTDVSFTPTGSANTWETKTSTTCLDTGTYTAGGIMTIKIKLTAAATNGITRVSTISFDYLAKF